MISITVLFKVSDEDLLRWELVQDDTERKVKKGVSALFAKLQVCEKNHILSMSWYIGEDVLKVLKSSITGYYG